MMKKFGFILIAFILLFCACRKKECRKKEDTVSGDALEIVLAQNGKDFIYPDIPDSLYLKEYIDQENKYPCGFPNVVVLNENELDVVNSLLIQQGFTIPNLDFNNFSYYIFMDWNTYRGRKLNINLKINNNDSISIILDKTEYETYYRLGLETSTDTRFLVIKTNKINFRKYEKINNCKLCN